MIDELGYPLHLRDGTKDAEAVTNVAAEYKGLKFDDCCTVLDIGGHIGLFARIAYARGASRVVSVEPDPDNSVQHRLNLYVRPQHLLLQAACVGHDGHSTYFYINPGANKARHSLQQHEGFRRIVVAALEFKTLIDWVQPTLLKVDAEGAEYSYDWTQLPMCVLDLVVEFHSLDTRGVNADSIDARIRSQGFERYDVRGTDRTYRTCFYRR